LTRNARQRWNESRLRGRRRAGRGSLFFFERFDPIGERAAASCWNGTPLWAGSILRGRTLRPPRLNRFCPLAVLDQTQKSSFDGRKKILVPNVLRNPIFFGVGEECDFLSLPLELHLLLGSGHSLGSQNLHLVPLRDQVVLGRRCGVCCVSAGAHLDGGVSCRAVVDHTAGRRFLKRRTVLRGFWSSNPEARRGARGSLGDLAGGSARIRAPWRAWWASKIDLWTQWPGFKTEHAVSLLMIFSMTGGVSSPGG